MMVLMFIAGGDVEVDVFKQVTTMVLMRKF